MAVGDMDTMTINVEDYPKIIPSLNLALTELYKRFPIRIEEVIIRQEPQISTYYLHSRYAMTNDKSSEPIKYIHDSVYEPFTDNVLRIEQVFNELGTEIPINTNIDYGEDEDYNSLKYEPYLGTSVDYDFQSIVTPTYNSLQILPHPVGQNNLLVKYRASHHLIKVSANLVPGETEVDVPLSMLEPLLLYVGGRIHANMHGEDPNSGAGFIAKFEASCKKIEDLNLFNKGNVNNTKLERTGWV